jgi:hypothetical protein
MKIFASIIAALAIGGTLVLADGGREGGGMNRPRSPEEVEGMIREARSRFASLDDDDKRYAIAHFAALAALPESKRSALLMRRPAGRGPMDTEMRERFALYERARKAQTLALGMLKARPDVAAEIAKLPADQKRERLTTEIQLHLHERLVRAYLSPADGMQFRIKPEYRAELLRRMRDARATMVNRLVAELDKADKSKDGLVARLQNLRKTPQGEENVMASMSEVELSHKADATDAEKDALRLGRLRWLATEREWFSGRANPGLRPPGNDREPRRGEPADAERPGRPNRGDGERPPMGENGRPRGDGKPNGRGERGPRPEGDRPEGPPRPEDRPLPPPTE